MVGRRPQHAVSKLACLVLSSVTVPDRVVPVFVQVVSPPLGWSPLSSFLVIWSPSGDTRVPSVAVPCPELHTVLPFSRIADYVYDFCELVDVLLYPTCSQSLAICLTFHKVWLSIIPIDMKWQIVNLALLLTKV